MAAYLPCKNTGQKTVYTQQRSYFQALPKKRKDQDRDPLKAWIADFKTEVEGWIEHQEQVVIRVDANSDVRMGPLALMLQSLVFSRRRFDVT